MTELLEQLRALTFDSLTAKEAVELCTALKEAVAKGDRWIADLVRNFGGLPALLDRVEFPSKDPVGRPPVPASTSQPVKPPDLEPPKKRRRGRPVPALKVEFPGKKRAQPIAVGGADAEDGPKPAELFQDSYVSREGPRPGAQLPPDHPRRSLHRESSVTPEVDMSDFHEVEEQMRKSGGVGKMFQ
jgi:hypothetical protein